MKLEADIEGKQHQIEIKRDGDKVLAEIDGRSFDVEVSEPESGTYLIKNQGKIFEAYVAPRANQSEPMKVSVGGREIEVRITDPKRLRGTFGIGEQADGLAEIKTAMPGKVVRFLVEAGTAVEKGDSVMVVEAMKMQNELKSPKNGIVREIRISEGDTVAAGDVLAIVE